MCYFIMLVAPTEDQVALHALMEKHGRSATAVSNASMAKLLLPDERQYLTFGMAGCDCSTVLTWPRHERERDARERFAHEEAKIRRKGWSEAKIQRALDGKRRAFAKPSPKADSYELWATILSDLLTELKLPRVGLVVHDFSGSLEEETVQAVRTEVPKRTSVLSAVENMRPDVLTIFTPQQEGAE